MSRKWLKWLSTHAPTSEFLSDLVWSFEFPRAWASQTSCHLPLCPVLVTAWTICRQWRASCILMVLCLCTCRSLLLWCPLPLLHLICLIYFHLSIKSHLRYKLFRAHQSVFSADTAHRSEPINSYMILDINHCFLLFPLEGELLEDQNWVFCTYISRCWHLGLAHNGFSIYILN